MNNYLVSQDTHLSKLWMVSAQRKGVSATVWETDATLGFHKTAKTARAALEASQGGKLTAWTKHIGRGCATYTAQGCAGLILDGAQLGERQPA